jgi:cerevisin
LSHRSKLDSKTRDKYYYLENGGEGVDVYILDTGIYTEHIDFEGRAFWGKTILKNHGHSQMDGHGHGTHCSSTILGKQFGVAKKANIFAVKVVDETGKGTTADLIKGIEWVTNTHLRKIQASKSSRKTKTFKGSVVNISLGGGKSPVVERAINSAVDAGLHIAVAAGNDNDQSCHYSPAGAEKAITVAASNIHDEKAWFSNHGKCVDIFAPGVDILSAWIGNNTASKYTSGTSIATPHVAGLIAYYLSLQPEENSAYAVLGNSPETLKKRLIAVATRGILVGIPAGTPNVSRIELRVLGF